MTKLAFYGIVAACAVAFVGSIVVKIRNDGYNAAITKMEKQNETAKKAADTVRRNVAECHASAGVWDVITAKCLD